MVTGFPGLARAGMRNLGAVKDFDILFHFLDNFCFTFVSYAIGLQNCT